MSSKQLTSTEGSVCAMKRAKSSTVFKHIYNPLYSVMRQTVLSWQMGELWLRKLSNLPSITHYWEEWAQELWLQSPGSKLLLETHPINVVFIILTWWSEQASGTHHWRRIRGPQRTSPPWLHSSSVTGAFRQWEPCCAQPHQAGF